MSRMSWCMTLGALLALGGAARADDGPCKAPRSCTPCEVPSFEQRLLSHVDLDFKDTPLKQVIEDLRQMAQINIVADVDALREAGVNLDCPLSLKVEDISLKSALNLLVKQVRLTYVIEDEVLQITTEEHAKGKLKMVTYPVAELVVPFGSGECELAPFICRTCPELAGKRTPGTTAEEFLLRLITSTIEPSSWSEVGGKGTIQYFPLGLALVVNQTQDVQEQIADLLTALRRAQNAEYPEEQLVAQLVKKTPSGEEVMQLPKMTFFRGQQICIWVGDEMSIRDGTIRDCLHRHDGDTAAQDKGAPPKRPDLVRTGPCFIITVTKAEHGKLKIDARFEKNEITEATTTGLHVAGQTYRLIQRVDSGSTVKMVLSKDERGEPLSWAVLTLTQLPVAEECEQTFQGNLPPIPRDSAASGQLKVRKPKPCEKPVNAEQGRTSPCLQPEPISLWHLPPIPR